MIFLVRIVLIFLLFLNVSFAQADTIRLATYNILRFPDSEGVERVPHFRNVLTALKPDILVVQEMQSQDGVDLFVDQIINNPGMSGYKAAPFINGFDTDNALFYNSNKIEFVRNRQILTWLREVSEYTLKYKLDETSPVLKIYSLHLKASQGSDNESKRLKDALIIRDNLNKLNNGAYFAVAGDFNIYSSNEPAYQELTGPKENNIGRCFDPINKPGEWHNNSSFAMWHTQSSRTTEFGSGTPGGMDDRFDFILLSNAFFDSSQYLYLNKSYKTFGNDGLHFNAAINAGYNRAVSDEIANALHDASDHLPVFLDFQILQTTTVENRQSNNLDDFSLTQNYPNPFNGSTTVSLQLNQAETLDIEIYNILGEKVFEHSISSTGKRTVQFSWNGKDSSGHLLNSGVYLLSVQSGQFSKTIKMLYVK